MYVVGPNSYLRPGLMITTVNIMLCKLKIRCVTDVQFEQLNKKVHRIRKRLAIVLDLDKEEKLSKLERIAEGVVPKI